LEVLTSRAAYTSKRTRRLFQATVRPLQSETMDPPTVKSAESTTYSGVTTVGNTDPTSMGTGAGSGFCNIL
jgi:hypothetical protein